jgi:iron(III) transport system ATP-binding protein
MTFLDKTLNPQILINLMPPLPIEPAILQIDNITQQFSTNASLALNHISLTLAKGDILALLGPSGCGKTSLLRSIAGFDRPQSGTITIGGKLVSDRDTYLPPEQRGIGIVFQDYALFPHLNIAENISFGLNQLAPVDRQQRVTEVLELVRLQGLEKRYPYELSGGQQQRIALARALAPKPQLMLLDEPLSNLDIQVRSHLREEIRDILKAAGTSAIFVTHDREEALFVADFVAVMQSGQIEQLGTPEEIYTQPASRFVAQFVTQAHFFPARRQGDTVETEIGNFEIPAHYPEEVSEIAIRPEESILTLSETGLLRIRTRRFIGREYQYCLQTTSGNEFHIRMPAELPLPVGARVDVSISPGAIHVFAPAGNQTC